MMSEWYISTVRWDIRQVKILLYDLFSKKIFTLIEYVVSTETVLGENSRLVLSKCVLTVGQRKRIVQGESVQHVMESKEPVEAPATEAEPR